MGKSLPVRVHALVLALVSILASALLAIPAAAQAEECPNAAFRQGPSSHLPDCRAYELLTPSFKNMGEGILTSYSPGGSSGMFEMNSAVAGLESFGEAGGSGASAYYSTQRTASGWTSVADNLPRSEYLPYAKQVNGLGSSEFQGDSADGQTTVWLDRLVGQPGNSVSIFKRLPDRSIVDVGPGLPPTAPSGSPEELGAASQLQVTGVSSDASHLLFTLQGDRWPFDSTESGESLYEYVGTGDTTPMLVGVNREGTVISKCGTQLGAAPSVPESNGSALGANSHNAMSTDGRTIFFTATCGVRTGNELYARIDNGEADARTVDISEPTTEDCSACDTEAGVLTGDAHFDGASEDGSKVFFSTTQPLLPGATGLNIYQYDADAPAGERVVRITGGAADPEIVGTTKALVSENGSRAYFLANGVLTTTPNEQGETAEAGGENLYMFERDSGSSTGRTAFVARLASKEQTAWQGEGHEGHGSGGSLSPDGRFLVFTSERDLTPDDTSKELEQAFEYDAQTGELIRVSIGQDGFNNNGNVPSIFNFPELSGAERHVADSVKIVSPASDPGGFFSEEYYASAYSSSLSVSADGSVVFSSPVGLTPQALDRKAIFSGTFAGDGEGNGAKPTTLLVIYANNIYQYRDGRVSLISDGQDLSYAFHAHADDDSEVQLLGTDESGSDILFQTVDQLTGQDTDTSLDIYDARIDGGFPAPVLPAPCAGEACQGPLSGAPTLLSPGSEFQTGGNPPLAESAPAAVKPKPKAKPKAKARPKKCKKGAALKRRKCVKAKTKKSAKGRK
jgi:hypothetical protein